MTTLSFSMTVHDEHSSVHKIKSITKCNTYDLKLILDNDKAIIIDERHIMTHELIATESMYYVRITKG